MTMSAAGWEWWSTLGERLGVDHAMLCRLTAAQLLQSRYNREQNGRREFQVQDEEGVRVAITLSKMGIRTWAKEIERMRVSQTVK